MVDEKNKHGHEDDFDDFGFADEDDFEPSEEEQLYGKVPNDEAAGSSENFSEELLAEMEASDNKKPFAAEGALQWLQENKLIAAGAGFLVLVLMFLFFFRGGKAPQQQHNQAVPAVAAGTSDSNQAKNSQEVDDFFQGKDSLAELSYQPKQVASVEENTAVETAEKRDNERENRARYQENAKENKYIRSKLDDFDKRLTSIETMLNNAQSINQAVVNLNSQLTNSFRAIDNNDKAIRTITRSVASLNKTMQTIKKDMFREALLEQANLLADGQSSNQPEYQVQASIPGRAWLRNKDGILITVRIGQEIPGFGKVSQIDPVKGTVTMADDTVFKEEN